MKTTFNSKIYPGKHSRPNVEDSYFSTENAYSIGVPWGNADALRLLNQNFKENLHKIKSADKNALVDLYKQSNKEIYSQFNKDFYTSACESLLLQFQDFNLTWIQVGQPSIILLRENKTQILQAGRDLSTDYSMASVMPAELLGIAPEIDVQAEHFLTRSGDTLILFNGPSLPINLVGFSASTAEEALTTLFEITAKENKDSAFWLATLAVD